MLSNYNAMLRNELTSNFKIYDARHKFMVIFGISTGHPIKVDAKDIYERLFSSSKNNLESASHAIMKVKGGSYVTSEMFNVLEELLKGDFKTIQSRDPNSIKIINVLSHLIQAVESSDSIEVLTAVRNSASEISKLRTFLMKLVGDYTKQDADKFEVVSKMYDYFKTRNSKPFADLFNLYDTLVKKSPETLTRDSKFGSKVEQLDYKSANKISKKTTEAIIKLFNSKESYYTEIVQEIAEISPSLFGNEINSLNDILNNKISTEQLNEIKPLIRFYLHNLNALQILASNELSELGIKYDTVDDSFVDAFKEKVTSAFGASSLIHNDIKGSSKYVIGITCETDYDTILDFLKNDEIKEFSVYMIFPSDKYATLDQKAIGFLEKALEGDLDEALDSYGTKADITTSSLLEGTGVKLLGTNGNDEEGIKHSKILYYSIVAVEMGFNPNNLAFFQKFARK